MQYITPITVGLLALILIVQLRILGRLDDIARQPSVASPVSAVAISPGAAAIAAEIRRQIARDEPPSFSFQHRNSGTSNGQLTHAVFRMIRKVGPAKEVSVKAEPGIISQIEKVKSDDSDSDFYELSFKPQNSVLPASWKFSVSYIDHEDKPQERSFDATYHHDKEPPAHLQIAERHEHPQTN